MNISRRMDYDSIKEWNLTLVLSTCPSYNNDIKIKLNFYNVQDIKIGNINNFFKIFLEIVDISGAKMGNWKYCVEEIEYSMISLKCSDISYDIIT